MAATFNRRVAASVLATPLTYKGRKRFGGMGKSQLSELRSLERENVGLKKILAELELDKLILKESLSYLKPRA